ncbi:hypothetical protein GQ56_0120795 [Burkholderia paludis]|nr:hypothetical protein GQ56_0120795 [Burkholderia paludis]
MKPDRARHRSSRCGRSACPTAPGAAGPFSRAPTARHIRAHRRDDDAPHTNVRRHTLAIASATRSNGTRP